MCVVFLLSLSGFLLTLGGGGEQQHLVIRYLKHINGGSPPAPNCMNLGAAPWSLVQLWTPLSCDVNSWWGGENKVVVSSEFNIEHQVWWSLGQG